MGDRNLKAEYWPQLDTACEAIWNGRAELSVTFQSAKTSVPSELASYLGRLLRAWVWGYMSMQLFIMVREGQSIIVSHMTP